MTDMPSSAHAPTYNPALTELLADMKKEHDRLPFDQLKGLYNFQKTTCWQRTFLRLLADEAQRIKAQNGSVRVLDIGCGSGIGRRPHWTAAVRPEFDELWGVEPDTSIRPAEGVVDHFQHALLEDADLPENSFDLAYSFMVVEHVADPVRFLNTVNRALKPGGVHFFVTVNGRHYFARLAKAMKTLKLEELVLRVLRGKHIEEYHYPVQYRMNRTSQLDRLARETGFDQPEYVLLEEEGPLPYMKGPLKLFWHAMMWKRRTFKNPNQLLELYGRMRKRAD